MFMRNTFKIVLVLSCIVSLSFVGCHKKETVEVDNETQSAVDNSLADQEYSEIPGSVNDHAINTKGTGATRDARIILPCDSLTKISGDTLWTSPTHVNPTYTMNISNANCGTTMPDGRTRTGKVEITLRGKIRKPGSKMLIKMIGYNVILPMGTTTANISYSCDSMVVTTLDSSALFTKFNVKLYNGVCLWGAGKVIKYSSDRTITTYPKGNPINTDPVTEVFGTANGINRDAKAFTVVIPQSTPLVKHRACKYIDKGIFELTPDGFKTRIVDFGNGTCDNKATFTVNGNTVAFTLN